MNIAKTLGMIASVAVLTAAGSAGSKASVNLIVNGSFETPILSNSFYQNYGPVAGDPNYGGASIPGWSITGNVDIVNNLPGGWQPQAGNQSLDLFGNTAGAISQSFTTISGRKYNLSFYYSNNGYGSPQPSSANVFVVGFFPILLSANISHSGATPGNMNWTLYSGSFVADSSFTDLYFFDASSRPCCNGGIALDNISVSAAVPEPATWGMMILGFLGLGFMAHRRRQRAALAA